jgi:hypothetical protein
MRLVQRHGRIDRINSRHESVFLHTFFPDRQLDRLLNLEQRVRHKLAQAAASVGVEQAPIADMETDARSFGETREEIERLQNEDAELFERGGTTSAAQSGEEYREQLRRGLDRDRASILELPWKAGSGIVGGDLPGHAFCARIRDRTYLRFVPLDEGEPIDGELGICLRYFECDPDTDRAMAPEMAERAFDAWQRARADIHDAWMHETDPANLQPRLRPISRRLRAQLDEHPPRGASSQQVVRWLDIAESPIPIREERELRTILDDESLEGAEKSRRLGEAMDELGLEPFSAPDPLPPVSPDEVRLVCWMAVHEGRPRAE